MYEGGTSEGRNASDYFSKWGWYSTLYELAGGKPWKFDWVLKWNVHEMHVFMAHKKELKRLKAKLRKK